MFGAGSIQWPLRRHPLPKELEFSLLLLQLRPKHHAVGGRNVRRSPHTIRSRAWSLPDRRQFQSPALPSHNRKQTAAPRAYVSVSVLPQNTPGAMLREKKTRSPTPTSISSSPYSLCGQVPRCSGIPTVIIFFPSFRAEHGSRPRLCKARRPVCSKIC